MPRINLNGPSNAFEERGDEPSPGISSLTSGSKPEWNGTSGMTDLPSPAPIAESLSSPDPAPWHPSSTADSTDGSGLETGSSQLSPLDYSEDSAKPKPATLDLAPEADLPSDQLMAMAREAYFDRNFDEADRLLNLAETNGEDPTAIGAARGYVAEARARALASAPADSGPVPAGPGEEDPAAGGYLVP